MSRSAIYNRLNYVYAPLGTNAVNPLYSTLWPPLRNLPSGPDPRYCTQGEEGRPQLVSYHEYGTPDLWWVVLEYNGILRAQDLLVGTFLKFPTLPVIQNWINQAVDLSTSVNAMPDRRKPKTQQQNNTTIVV